MLLLDWSGVLSDDRRTAHATINMMCEFYGIQGLDFDDWRNDTQSSAVTHMQHLGVKDNPREMQKLYERYYLECAEKIPPVPYTESVEAIENICRMGTRIVVISTHHLDRPVSEAKEYGIFGNLSKIYGVSPDKSRDIAAACRESNSEPGNSMYVGDTTFDMRCARKAGAIAVAKLGGYHSRKKLEAAKPDMIISDLKEIEGMFVF